MKSPSEQSDEINALAREIVARRMWLPAYLVDDESWAAALAEAEATYEPPEPKPPLQQAIARARCVDPVAFIEAYNRGRRS